MAGCDKSKDTGQPQPIDTMDTQAAPPGDGVLVDDLSMPLEPTLSASDFNSAADCENCHPEHHEQWKTSGHAYAMVDPIFRGLTTVRQLHLEGTEDLFCTQCHSAIGSRGGDILPGYQFDALAPMTLEGITCESCHKVSEIARPYNSGHVLDGKGPIRGPIEDPEESTYHGPDGLEYSPIFDSSEFCAGCHDLIETGGLPLERPYEEWITSPAAEEGTSCQSCHMPTTTEPLSTEFSTERTLHDHSFIGVDVPLLDGFLSEDDKTRIRAGVIELLDQATTVSLQLPEEVQAGQQLDLVVTVRNDIEGHNFPTGSTFLRQAWLEVVATDQEGTELFSSGLLDANGDLRDHWSELDPYGDHDLVTFHSGLLDEFQAPTRFTHAAMELSSNAIAPLKSKTFTFFVPTAVDTEGPVDVTVKLRFRAIAPHVLRLLESALGGGFDSYRDEVEIFDIDTVSGTIDVSP
jgi:hypothetical protein